MGAARAAALLAGGGGEAAAGVTEGEDDGVSTAVDAGADEGGPLEVARTPTTFEDGGAVEPVDPSGALDGDASEERGGGDSERTASVPATETAGLAGAVPATAVDGADGDVAPEGDEASEPDVGKANVAEAAPPDPAGVAAAKEDGDSVGAKAGSGCVAAVGEDDDDGSGSGSEAGSGCGAVAVAADGGRVGVCRTVADGDGDGDGAAEAGASEAVATSSPSPSERLSAPPPDDEVGVGAPPLTPDEGAARCATGSDGLVAEAEVEIDDADSFSGGAGGRRATEGAAGGVCEAV